VTVRVPAEAIRAAVRVAGGVLLSERAPIPLQRHGLLAITRPIRTPRTVGVDRTGIRAASRSLPGDWLTPADAASDAALLYLHGGGYVLGSPSTHRGLVARLAARMRMPALVLDYRLAPEHPYPAALEDALAAYTALIAGGREPARIAVAGDSAGGGLALALAMTLRERGLPAPAVLGLICPWLDLKVDLDGGRASAPREPLLTPKNLTSWAGAYVGRADVADPAISPVNGDLRGLPPVVVDSAGDDLIFSDAQRLVLASRQFPDSEIEHRNYDALWHDFHMLVGVLAEADQAIDALGDGLRLRLDLGAAVA